MIADEPVAHHHAPARRCGRRPAAAPRLLAAALLALAAPLPAAAAPASAAAPPSASAAAPPTSEVPTDGVAAALARLIGADGGRSARRFPVAVSAPPDGAPSALAGLGWGDGAAGDDGDGRARHARNGGAAAGEGGARYLDALRHFYGERGFEPAWLGPGGLSPRALAMLDALQSAEEHGLASADYRPSALPPLPSISPAEWLAALELNFSRTLLDFAGDLHTGRLNPQAVDPELVLARAELGEAEVLRAAVEAAELGEFLGELAPQNPYYRGLHRALADYRTLAGAGGWPTIDAGPNLEVGATGERVAALRRRLAITGDLLPVEEDAAAGGGAAAGRDDLYDAAVAEGVRAFQRRHGLHPDGVVGPRTLVALNVSAEERMRQIVVNMERWRWMPDDLGARYLLVNLAGFDLKVVEGGRTVLAMPVVVGQPYRSTPVFSDVMSYIVTNPYWNVPPTIAREDMLPKLRQNPYHLIDQGLRVFSGWGGDADELDPRTVDWSRLGDGRRFPYRLRQDPGPQNPLGRLKFMFPNKYDVYLHDTPSRGLFSRAVRAGSSGCIRLADPIALAEYLLRDHPRIGPGGIRGVIASGRTLDFRLSEPVPIHLTYSTAWVDEEGVVQFRDDIYGRDARLSEALFPTLHAAVKN